MSASIRRRQLLTGAGAAALLGIVGGCRVSSAPLPRRGRFLDLVPVRASVDRITRITVCTRPFRAQGPRLEVERVGTKSVVHNYGHGGSGWSLSWGYGSLATALALGTGERNIAVIGCGAIGLTTATVLQRAGARVTIYAKELPPQVRSSLATGLYTPDSRICHEDYATPAFRQQWAQVARQSFDMYQSFLGLPGTPVEFVDQYFVSDSADQRRRQGQPDPRPRFAELAHDLTPELIVTSEQFDPGSHSLGQRYLTRNSELMFNISSYAHTLLSDFYTSGGRLEIAEFGTPADLARIQEKTLVNCTGYGARALFQDTSVIPVRGQLARMMPAADVNYGLFYKSISFVPRRDGWVFQDVGDNDYFGYNIDTAQPDRSEAERAVRTIASLFA
jgi:glycine/D-amino acid oxidase-like deaminating enzyme